MSKRTRQYIGILAALAAYYLVHEGAHLLYALLTGVFKQINFMGLGVQIDVYAEHMTNIQHLHSCLTSLYPQMRIMVNVQMQIFRKANTATC